MSQKIFSLVSDSKKKQEEASVNKHFADILRKYADRVETGEVEFLMVTLEPSTVVMDPGAQQYNYVFGMKMDEALTAATLLQRRTTDRYLDPDV